MGEEKGKEESTETFSLSSEVQRSGLPSRSWFGYIGRGTPFRRDLQLPTSQSIIHQECQVAPTLKFSDTCMFMSMHFRYGVSILTTKNVLMTVNSKPQQLLLFSGGEQRVAKEPFQTYLLWKFP